MSQTVDLPVHEKTITAEQLFEIMYDDPEQKRHLDEIWLKNQDSESTDVEYDVSDEELHELFDGEEKEIEEDDMRIQEISEDSDIPQNVVDKCEKIFLKSYEQSTPEQKRVIDAGRGIWAVLAGAGSGKTQTLTTRVANLVREGVDPKKICMLTFTVKSAQEMKRRAIAMNPYCKDIVAGTFHSVALRLLRNAEFGNEFRWRILEESAVYKEFSYVFYSNLQNQLYPDLDSVTDCMRKAHKEFDFEVNDIKHFAKICKEKDRNTAEVEYITRKLSKNEKKDKDYVTKYSNERPPEVVNKDETVLRILNQTYDNFQNYKNMKFMLELDDVVPEACRLLQEHPELQNVFEFVSVDEYQDTNEDQYLFSKLLSKGSGNLLCVGDDKQSIYEWRGASVDNFKKIVKDASRENTLRLSVNFRSTSSIVELANKTAELITDKLDLGDMTAHLKGGCQQSMPGVFANGSDQVRAIVAMMQKLHESGIPWNEMAVLYRSHKTEFSTSKILQSECIKNGIPIRLVGASRLRDAVETKIVLSFLNLLKYPTDRTSWVTILQIFPSVGDITAIKLANTAYTESLKKENWTAKDSFFAIQNSLNSSSRSTKSEEKLLAWNECMDGVKKIFVGIRIFSESDFLNVGTSDIAEVIRNVGEFLDIPSIAKRALFSSTKGKSEDEIETRRKTMKGNLEFLEDIATGCEKSSCPLDTFLDTFFTNSRDKKSEGEEYEEGVTLTTVHSAKGLEWNTVFIPDLVQKEFPIVSKSTNIETQVRLKNEEARLFYVAVSRAREHVFFSMPKTGRNAKGYPENLEASDYFKHVCKVMGAENRLKGNAKGFSDISFAKQTKN